MMPPGHVAVTWGVTTLLQQHNPQLARLDYRLLAVACLLPDIIDKPLAILVFTEAQTSQLVAHSLLFHCAILLPTLLFWRTGLPYVLAFIGHQILDRMWHHTESFWWPIYGWDTFWAFQPMNTPETMVAVYLEIITRYPQVWVVELLAVVGLLWYVRRNHLFRGQQLANFLRTGRLHMAVGGTGSEPSPL